MKKMLITGLLILLYVSSYSQNLDLVVTSIGDSIACKIDSISESTIYMQIKTTVGNKWTQTTAEINNISEYKFNCINPSEYAIKNGTSKITGKAQPVYPKRNPGKLSLENASQDELNFYLEKAKKTKKSGAIMSIAGPLSAAGGYLLIYTTFDLYETSFGMVFGSVLFLGGIGITFVGIPRLIAGSSGVYTINKIKNSKGVTFELVPCSFDNYQAQNHQHGATLRIRF